MADKKPNGRPRKKPENQRTQVMHVRMTERESSQLAEDAGAMNLTKADYIRHRVWGKAQGSRQANPERASVIMAISNIGSLCEDLRKMHKPMSDKEAHRLAEEIKLKLARYPSADAATNNSLRNLVDSLTRGMGQQPPEQYEQLLGVLEQLSTTLMDFLNGRNSR